MKLVIKVCPMCAGQRGGDRCIDCGTHLETRMFRDFVEEERELELDEMERAREEWYERRHSG